MTFADFRLQYPEFRQIGDAQVKAIMAKAALQVSATSWGNLYDAGHGALSAHMLASSALDADSPLLAGYLKEYKRMVKLVGGGFRVA